MTPLRRRMLEDMGIRNLAENTQLCYLHQVSAYARHFGCTPEDLGPEDVRAYQVHLVEVRKLSPSTVGLAACALRFLYRVTLKRDWDFDDIPLPKKPFRLPVILSREEVMRLLESVASLKHRTLLTTVYAAGLRLAECHAPEGQRCRQPAHGGAHRAGQGPQGPLRDAVAAAARGAARVLDGRAAEARSSRRADTSRATTQPTS